MFCKNCGQTIDDKAVVCPYCGVQVANIATEKKTNGLAIAGLILAFFMPLIGLILSIVGRKQCRERGEGGAGLALAGIIISIIEMVLAVIYVIAAFALVGAAITA